jgi:hypothetical protein
VSSDISVLTLVIVYFYKVELFHLPQKWADLLQETGHGNQSAEVCLPLLGGIVYILLISVWLGNICYRSHHNRR